MSKKACYSSIIVKLRHIISKMTEFIIFNDLINYKMCDQSIIFHEMIHHY